MCIRDRRKSVKLYMRNPIKVEVKSITTAKQQVLYLAEEDYQSLKGKRVLIVDDVISTGESLSALEKLVQEAGGNIVGLSLIHIYGIGHHKRYPISLDTWMGAGRGFLDWKSHMTSIYPKMCIRDRAWGIDRVWFDTGQSA